MIDRLHTLIGNTARYATPKEAEMILFYHDEMSRHHVALKDLTNKKNKMMHILKMRSGEKTPVKKRSGVVCAGAGGVRWTLVRQEE